MPHPRKAKPIEIVAGQLFNRQQYAERLNTMGPDDLLFILNRAFGEATDEYKQWVNTCGPVMLETLESAFKRGGSFKKILKVGSIEPGQLQFALLVVAASHALTALMIDELAEASEL